MVLDTFECYKCKGTKQNKRGTKPCKRCNGKGMLQGEFYAGLNDVIQQEINNYCNSEYKSLLEQELAANELE